MGSYLSARYLPLILKSSLGLITPLSMSSASPSGMGTAFMKSLLCLLGDLDRHITVDSVDGLPVGHDGVRLLQRDLSVIFLQILETDLEMEFTGSGNDVFAGLFNHALDHGIRLGQTLETLHELGEIRGVLGLNGHSHHGGHGELHHLHVVSVLEGRDGSGFDEELVHAYETADVSSGDVFNGLDFTAHHEDGPLNGFLVQVLLLSWDEVRSIDSGLHASGDLAREDTSEGVEAALVAGGDHL